MKKTISVFFLAFLFLSISFLVAYADVSDIVNVDFPPCPEGLTPCPDINKGTTDIRAYIIRFYQFAVGAAGIVAVGMIVTGGILISVNTGSVDKQSEGRDMITSALWGLALLFGSYLILNTINPNLVELKLPGQEEPSLDQEIKCPEGFTTSTIPVCRSESGRETLEGQQGPCPEGYTATTKKMCVSPSNDCGNFGDIKLWDGNVSLNQYNCGKRRIVSDGELTLSYVGDNAYYQLGFGSYSESISPGSQLWLYPYFKKDTAPNSTMKCLVYAYQPQNKEVKTVKLHESLNLCAPKGQDLGAPQGETCNPNEPLPENTLNDADARQALADLGISVHSSGSCTNRCDSLCTSLQGIPASVIGSLGRMKAGCANTTPRCDDVILVTGGTEIGHQAHGINKPVVDLSFDGRLATYLRTSVSALGIVRICTTAAHSQYRYNCNYDEPKEHLHVEFNQ